MKRMLARFVLALSTLTCSFGCSATDHSESLESIYPRLWVEREPVRFTGVPDKADAETGRLVVRFCEIPGSYDMPRSLREPSDVGTTLNFSMHLSPFALSSHEWQLQIPKGDQVLGLSTRTSGGGTASASISTQHIWAWVGEDGESTWFEREPARELIRSLLDGNNQEAAAIRALLLECGVPYNGELCDEQVFLVLTLAAARWPSQLREAIREGLEDPPQTLVGVAADHLMLPIFSSAGSPDAEIFLFDAPFFRMYLLPTAYYTPSEPEAAHLYFFGRGFRDGQYGHLGHVAIRRNNNDATRLVDVAAYLLSDMLTGYGKDF